MTVNPLQIDRGAVDHDALILRLNPAEADPFGLVVFLRPYLKGIQFRTADVPQANLRQEQFDGVAKGLASLNPDFFRV
ncbi:hypothetical protein D3C81_1347300 [compost metagenome]